MAQFATCLYCDEPTGSLEHVLASGIGGRLKSTTLVCGNHNNLCVKWADDPLFKQFEFAVHCLEALKGDGTRGTTWHGLIAKDGQRFDMLADFTARMPQRVEPTEDGGRLIMTTHPEGAVKIESQLAQAFDFAGSFTINRSDSFRPVCKTHDPGMRGVLKAAFHFVCQHAHNEDEARVAAPAVAEEIFRDAIPSEIVRVWPYDLRRARGTPHRHEMTAWNDDHQTLVLVKVFNVVHYLVTLPRIAIEPVQYRQDARTGEWAVTPTDVPGPIAIDRDPERAKTDFEQEYALRIDLIVALGQSKSDIADIIKNVTTSIPNFQIRPRKEKVDALRSAVQERFRYPVDQIPVWMIRDVEEFAERRIEEAVR